MTTHTTVATERTRPARAIRAGSVVLAALLTAGLISGRSSSAFTATTEANPHPVTGTAGTMKLTASADALTVTGMVPGDSFTDCVDVTYTGSIPASGLRPVQMYGKPQASGGLLPYLTSELRVGPAGSTCASSSFAAATSFSATGVYPFGSTTASDAGPVNTGWTPNIGSGSSDSRAVWVRFTLPDTVGNEAQGLSSTLQLTWDVSSQGRAA